MKEKRAIVPVLLYYYRMYRQFSSHCPDGILISEQGLLQGLISIVHIDSLKDLKALNKIIAFFAKKKLCVNFVHCKNDVALAQQRFLARHANTGRLDHCDDKELAVAMEKQQQNFEAVRSSLAAMTLCRQLTVDTKCPPEENARMILSFCNEPQ